MVLNYNIVISDEKNKPILIKGTRCKVVLTSQFRSNENNNQPSILRRHSKRLSRCNLKPEPWFITNHLQGRDVVCILKGKKGFQRTSKKLAPMEDT